MEKSINNTNNTKVVTTLKGLILVALCAVVFYPPYLQGLFFEKHQLPTEILVFALFIVFCAYKWIKKDLTLLKSPIEYICLGFVVVYLISVSTAVHTRSAITEVLKYCMYFAVFLMVTELADNAKVKTIFLWTIVLSATGVSIIGLNSAMGGTLVSFLNNLFIKLGSEGELFFGLYVDGRINSTLQYPNALASYVMAVFFIVIGLILSETKIWLKALYGACSYILLLTFMLTKSRGAQLLFPVAIVIFFIVSPKKTRVKTVFHALFLAAPAVGISLYILPYLSADEINRKALIIFTVGMVITALFAILAEYIGNLLQKIHWLVYVGLMVALVIALPLAVVHVMNASVPVELSHGIEEENSSNYITRDVSLIPGDYVLRFDADAKAEKEQPYIYTVSISAKTEDDIVFGGSTALAAKTFKEASEYRQESIDFTVPDGSNLITINFVNYYSGTGVTLNNPEIIDPISGDVAKKVVLKNKYNLESLITRFQNITQEKSGIVRFIFYKDGMKIFKDRWLLGGGGGAWEYLYRQYQSYSYPSSQAHNYPLQLGIETGVPGILVLLGLLIFLILGYLKYVKKIKDKSSPDLFINTAIIIAIAALFMHAAIDFDFSESAMLLLFWQLIALINRELRDYQVFDGKDSLETKKRYGKRGSIINVIGGALVSVIVLGLSISFYSAAQNAKEAFRYIQQSETEKAIESIKRAIELDKFNEKYILGFNPVATRPDIKTGLIDILFIKANLMQQQLNNGNEPQEAELQKLQQQFSEAHKQVSKLQEAAKHNLSLTTNLAGYNFQLGDHTKGIEYLNQAIQLAPFEPSLWYTKIDVYFELARTYFNNADDENAKKYLDEGLNIIREAMDVNSRNMNPFLFNESTIKVLEKMKYMYDYYDKDELHQINDVLHYTIPNFDINLDQVPDQWRSGDSGLINITTSEQGIQVHANDRSYIYPQNTIYFNKGKTYQVKLKLDRKIDYFAFEITGLVGRKALQLQEGYEYVGEVFVEKEVIKEQRSQMRIYISEDCIIESIVLIEK